MSILSDILAMRAGPVSDGGLGVLSRVSTPAAGALPEDVTTARVTDYSKTAQAHGHGKRGDNRVPHLAVVFVQGVSVVLLSLL